MVIPKEARTMARIIIPFALFSRSPPTYVCESRIPEDESRHPSVPPVSVEA